MYDSNVGIENHHNGMNKKIAFHLTFHVVHRRILIFTIRAYLEAFIHALMMCLYASCALSVYMCVMCVCLLEELL